VARAGEIRPGTSILHLRRAVEKKRLDADVVVEPLQVPKAFDGAER
jgi:hypothetical protein